jgi:L-histidine N-alpha-methyltransferase
MARAPSIEVVRSGADAKEEMAAEVRASLSAEVPWVACKYFYDAAGSALFEEITRLPEYYLTRTEEGILDRVAGDVVLATRPREIVELGSGTGRKTRRLLDAAAQRGLPERCTLLDIAPDVLADAVARLATEYPSCAFRGVAADFQRDLAALGPGHGRLLVFFASTIGNLEPDTEAPRFFASAARALGFGDAFLLGVDLEKDVRRLEAAYDDARGVTARFNLNVLNVLNERLGADFDLSAWRHVSFYDRDRRWIEMRVRSLRSQVVRVPAAGFERRFEAGADIRTEISAKYTRASLEARLAGSGLAVERWDTDPEALFALALLRKTK